MERYSLCVQLTMFVMGITVIRLGDGQIAPLCAEQLGPCIDYINSTKPPDICCNPIKRIDATHKTCFCNLGLTPGLLQSLGVTTAQALQLVHLCGVNFDITTCKVSSSALPPSKMQPPAMPGDDNGGADRVKSVGFSFLLFLCVSVLFN